MRNYLQCLNDIINIKPRSRKEVLMAYCDDRLFQKLLISNLVQLHNNYKINCPGNEISLKTKSIPEYDGSNKYVSQLKEFINKELPNDVYGCYVHGSIGTNEVIAYSDFDALVIINDDAFRNEKRLMNVIDKLSISKKFFFQFDPLQHHGWFVLSERMLNQYPVIFFPPVLFDFAKCLTGPNHLNITYCQELNNFVAPFYALTNGLLKTLKNLRHIKNMYELKSMLSEFMLLPAFYVQARDGVGIYKKHSFQIAATDFTEHEWEIMERVSGIRTNWNPNLSEEQFRLLSNHNYRKRRIAKKRAPLISNELQLLVNEQFFKEMENFINLAINKQKQNYK